MTKPIISFAVLILSTLFVFFYVVPEYSLNQTRRGDIETLSKILATSGEIEGLINDTKKSLDSINADVSMRFETFLPQKIDPIRFANNLQYIGRKNKVALSDIKVEAPVDDNSNVLVPTSNVSATRGLVNTGSKINQAEVVNQASTVIASAPLGGKFIATRASFTLTTTFEVFQLLLADLERSLGVINLTSLSIIALPEDASTKKLKIPPPPTYQFTIAIETYSLK